MHEIKKDSLGFTPNVMRVGSKVKWTTDHLVSTFGKTKSTRAMPGGLLVTPLDFPLEGKIVAISPTSPIITVDWGAESDYFGRTSKVLASNMAVDGSLQAALSTDQRMDAKRERIIDKNDPVLDRGEGQVSRASEPVPLKKQTGAPKKRPFAADGGRTGS